MMYIMMVVDVAIFAAALLLATWCGICMIR
jgi:hypothetical protein